MIRHFAMYTFLVTGLIAGSTAYADIVTETWTATVSSSSVSAYSPGDQVSWTVTYDDASTATHVYGDGANGIAEAGSGDDTLIDTFGINLCPDCSVWSDAEFDFGDIFQNLLEGGFFDNYNQNHAYITVSASNGTIMRYQSDAEYFDAYSDFPNSQFLATYADGYGNFIQVENVRRADASAKQIPVLPPLALFTLAIGALFLGTWQLKRRPRA